MLNKFFKLVFIVLCFSLVFSVTAVADQLEHPSQIQRINVVDLQDLHSQETVVFIDTRTAAEWQRATDKIPGAIRITTQAEFEEFKRSVPTDTAVVTYCT